MEPWSLDRGGGGAGTAGTHRTPPLQLVPHSAHPPQVGRKEMRLPAPKSHWTEASLQAFDFPAVLGCAAWGREVPGCWCEARPTGATCGRGVHTRLVSWGGEGGACVRRRQRRGGANIWRDTGTTQTSDVGPSKHRLVERPQQINPMLHVYVVLGQGLEKCRTTHSEPPCSVVF